MSAAARNRQPSGVPSGGQFAVSAHPEADVSLGADGPHWVMIEREHGAPLAVGPFTSADTAEVFMNGSVQVQGLAEEDSLDVYVGSGDLAPEVGRIPVQPDDDHGPDVERITALVTDFALDPADLDDTVRDVTDQMASDMVNASDGDLEDAQDEHYGQMDVHAASVNNGGVRSQVGFLVDQLGASRAEEVIREAAGARTAGVLGTCACDRLTADFQHAWPHARACPAHSPNACPGCARMRARAEGAAPA